MADYGHELLFGTFLTPSAAAPESVVGLARLSEELGYDLVTFQDHPYQPAFLDTWTLLSYVAAATAQITLAPNVLNLPLRPPAVVARAAASLDRLSGGRVELALGAGAFADAAVAMGAPRRSPAQAVEALDEAITVIRELWDTDTRGGVRVAGRHYTVAGAKRGPAPAQRIGIWLGAYKPRMLRLTGARADGWLPSSGYLPPEGLAEANAIIDDAAGEAGRSPADVRRIYNISGSFTGRGFLQGPPDRWVDELAELALEQGIGTFVFASDRPEDLHRFAEEVIPDVRRLVALQRARPRPTEPPAEVAPTLTDPPRPAADAPDPAVGSGPRAGRGFPLQPTVDDGIRLAPVPRWDERTRPSGPAPDPDRTYAAGDVDQTGQLIAIHDHLRGELEQVRDLVAQVRDGVLAPGRARSAINEMTMRQNGWTVGAYCAAYCRLVATHHTIEDQALFPRLRSADPRLAAVVDRLAWEHTIIHDVLEGLDRALVRFVGPAPDGSVLQRAVDELNDALVSHLAYEERELLEPLARLGILI